MENAALETMQNADTEEKPSLNDNCMSTMENEQQEEIKESSSQQESFDPLFMDCLPADFSTNPKLSALASLLNDEDFIEDDGKNNRKKQVSASTSTRPVVSNAGGGKVRNRQSTRAMATKATIPYLIPQKSKETRQTSMGEAQLFLKLWKI
mmetsp:Transcript_11637/g.21765  ORF Transcript_11637/g.21765 Transcript_11637/m.21765 type:complete len:151 (+) Transcript_11637:1-453(+)